MEKLPKALFFDVFGTCVDWRRTVTLTLDAEYQQAKLKAVTTQTPPMVEEDWAKFAQQWRNSYKRYTRTVSQTGGAAWKTIDEHHLDSLKELLTEWKLEGIWDDSKVEEISLVWHRLDPWADTSEGITQLNQLTETCTLSNGNISLLQDLCKHAGMDMTRIFSAEMFKHYKPHPATYLGAVRKVGHHAGEVAMVAAHLNDLQAAKSHGLHTIYVERPQEEDWDIEQRQKAKQEGWVDIWVEEGEGGFLRVAERLAHLPRSST